MHVLLCTHVSKNYNALWFVYILSDLSITYAIFLNPKLDGWLLNLPKVAGNIMGYKYHMPHVYVNK